jgi:hypothetical protein
MYNPNKPKIDPMNMDFDFMIKNHPEFFTKLSSQNFNHPPSPTPRRPPSSTLPPVPGGYPTRGRGGGGRRVGGPGATLKPKISANTDEKCT